MGGAEPIFPLAPCCQLLDKPLRATAAGVMCLVTDKGGQARDKRWTLKDTSGQRDVLPVESMVHLVGSNQKFQERERQAVTFWRLLVYSRNTKVHGYESSSGVQRLPGLCGPWAHPQHWEKSMKVLLTWPAAGGAAAAIPSCVRSWRQRAES